MVLHIRWFYSTIMSFLIWDTSLCHISILLPSFQAPPNLHSETPHTSVKSRTIYLKHPRKKPTNTLFCPFLWSFSVTNICPCVQSHTYRTYVNGGVAYTHTQFFFHKNKCSHEMEVIFHELFSNVSCSMRWWCTSVLLFKTTPNVAKFFLGSKKQKKNVLACVTYVAYLFIQFPAQDLKLYARLTLWESQWSTTKLHQCLYNCITGIYCMLTQCIWDQAISICKKVLTV